MDVFDALPLSFGSSRTGKDPNSYKNRNRDSVCQVVENSFHKCFEFSNKRVYLFPSQNELFASEKWEVIKLQQLKVELNRVKSKLNSYNLADWHNHTRKNNYAGTVMRALRKFQPEFLTQAWCKFYEIVSRYKLIPKQCLKKKLLNSVHLCEAPGAFITSLNHFLKLNHPDLEWKWFATTLNPYYEGNDLQHMVNDDRFIINTLENWWFGNDETGDVYGENYLNSLIEKAKSLHPVYLVTADGSINCLSDPAEQENNVVHLHITETICALNILERGGSFLLKTFTMFECDTVCLMYLLRCCFTHINVFKPVTSKEGNSEVYVVCLGYKGRDHVPILEKLNLYYYEKVEETLFFKNDIPHLFIEEIINCATKFKLIQTSVIERNIETFKHQHKRKRSRLQLMDIRDSTATLFIEKYKIRPINPKDFVVHNQDADAICLNLFPRDESGTFLERKSFKQLNTSATLDFYKGKLDLIVTDWDVEDVFWFAFDHNSKINHDLKYGKPIEKVRTSKFCKGNLLAIYTELEKLHLQMGVKLNIPDQLNLDNFNSQSCVDTNSFSWTENYSECQKAFVEKLTYACNKLENEDGLILKWFPLLTQFNVGMIFVLGHLFEKVGFVNPRVSPYSIILNGLKSTNLKLLISSISSSMCQHKADGLISLVPITDLCEPEFLRCVTWINQISLKTVSLIMLDVLKETT